MRWRLSVLMFLQYAVPGAWLPLFPLHLQELHFSKPEIAYCCATSAIGALLAPLLWGQIADRLLAAQRCISLCAAAAGVVLWLMAELTAPWAVFAAGLGMWFFMVPVFSLGAALTFRHLPHPDKQFGPIRMWGTVGWVAGGWLLAFGLTNPLPWQAFLEWARPHAPATQLPDALRLGSVFAFLLGVYAWTLPETPPQPRRLDIAPPASRLAAFLDAPLLALRLFRQRALFVFALCLAGLYFTMPFSGQMTPLLLEHLGVRSSWLPATLTIAQSLEILTLATLPVILLKFGEKGTLLLGILAWTAALAVLTLGEPLWLVVASLGLHGIYITCFLVAGQVVVNRRAADDIRASAQGLLHFMNGFGLLAGHISVGWVRQWAGPSFALAFAPATILAMLLFVVFLLAFRTERKTPATTSLPAAR